MIEHSIGSKAEGYPCPKDGVTLQLIEDRGAWCPECKTVWRQVGEIDLDATVEDRNEALAEAEMLRRRLVEVLPLLQEARECEQLQEANPDLCRRIDEAGF